MVNSTVEVWTDVGEINGASVGEIGGSNVGITLVVVVGANVVSA